ncbi:MAG TPA: cyclopropane-fatty-acyl-phospholipid synthase family protein [Beijerinckiaceae bacterium]|nr:cyclopropane-fatty-acyl-phospholipid synthase family protein [Beijerinckiaceae bacterium]
MDRLLEVALARVVKRGSLEVVTAGGRRRTFGDGTSPRVRIRFADRGAARALLLDPELALGELYTDGRLVIERGALLDLLQLLLQDTGGHLDGLPLGLLYRARAALRRFVRRNTPRRARRNVAHHYDLDDRLYALFLDADRQYSCAYFERPDQSLEEAQLAKKRHIAAKLLLEPGQRVLDIGSGWGGLALYLAEAGSAGEVRGVTLSQEQLGVARRRAEERGLSRAVAFDLRDYRAVQDRFDRIVSVGMFEHVGLDDYDTFFGTLNRLLAEDGVALVHTIGRTGAPGPTNPWLERYIFPGGYLPSLSEIAPPIERAGLILTDVEVLRLHYADTLRLWRERFMARRAEAAALYDERFCRMWEFYLAGCEAVFRWSDCVVFQLQLAKRNDVVPRTRDYIARRTEALRRAETKVSRLPERIARPARRVRERSEKRA